MTITELIFYILCAFFPSIFILLWIILSEILQLQKEIRQIKKGEGK